MILLKNILNSSSQKIRFLQKLDSPDQNFSQKLDSPNLKFAPNGFTLIEVIIAIAVFSILALGANALLSNVATSSEVSAQREADFEQLQRAMLIMERDFLQMQDRIPRVQGEENELVVLGGEFEFESDGDAIGFVRGGWQNPQLRLKRSTLQNVAYRLQENQLHRLHTNYVDAVIGTEPKVRVLLDGVSELKIEVLKNITDDLDWSESIADVTLPYAVAITLTTESFGEIRREFMVRI